MSWPVCFMTETMRSNDTECRPSENAAYRLASSALAAAYALRSMHGICTSPHTGSQVIPRWCSKPISAEYSICAGVPWRMPRLPLPDIPLLPLRQMRCILLHCQIGQLWQVRVESVALRILLMYAGDRVQPGLFRMSRRWGL